jgi:hypothetical protein
MAYAYLTMLDIAKANGNDTSVGLIEENLNAAPELEVLPARAITGTSFKTLVRTAYGSGAFRAANEGTEPVKSTYVNKTFETFYYDGQLEVDNAVATADEQGADHALAMEADGLTRGYMLDIGTQMWYGTNATLGDAKGFPGALGVVDSGLVIDATGTTDNVSTSVWAVCAQPKFFELIFGRNTALSVGEWRKQSITRSSKEITAYKNSLEGWIGAAYYSKYAVGRIKKLTTDSGKGLTDSLLAQLFAAFPVGVKPTHLFMSRRSRQQLQIARTVTLFGSGTNRPNQALLAPVPTVYDDVPIIATDSILNTETLAL